MLEHLKQLDTDLFLYLNDFHSPFWDEVMYCTSGRFIWIPLYAFILFLFVRKYKTRSYIPILGAIILITLSDQLSVHLFKNAFERLRPCHNPEIKDLVHLVRNHCGGRYGFVSSHAANSFALAFFSSFLIKKKVYSWSIFTWAIVVSYSRIYLGVHYPGDVICGAVFGVILALILLYLFNIVKKQAENYKTNPPRSP